jgi:hypothetical protein
MLLRPMPLIRPLSRPHHRHELVIESLAGLGIVHEAQIDGREHGHALVAGYRSTR